MMKKLSHDQRFMVARVLARFVDSSTGSELDFNVLQAMEQWISGRRKLAIPVPSLVPHSGYRLS